RVRFLRFLRNGGARGRAASCFCCTRFLCWRGLPCCLRGTSDVRVGHRYGTVDVYLCHLAILSFSSSQTAHGSSRRKDPSSSSAMPSRVGYCGRSTRPCCRSHAAERHPSAGFWLRFPSPGC